MAKVTRSNPKAFETLIARVNELDNKQSKAGWFESSVYPDGTPVAYVAAIQEYGAHIDHPGGTPYKIGADGRAVFVSKAEGEGLPTTKAHAIIIPPRPFMRPTVDREKKNWLEIMRNGAKAILNGLSSGQTVMDALGQRASADIARSITLVQSPPLKASTIAARLRKKSDKVNVGLLTKPLVDSGKMYEEVTYVVEDNNE